MLGNQNMVLAVLQLSQVEKAENNLGNCHTAWEELNVCGSSVCRVKNGFLKQEPLT